MFQLNGQKVFKSQTKKKTLNPEWHENFNVQVVSYEFITAVVVSLTGPVRVAFPCGLRFLG